MRNRFGSNRRRSVGRRSFSRARSIFEELQEDFDNIDILLRDAVDFAWEEEEEGIDSPLTDYFDDNVLEVDLSRVYRPIEDGVNAESRGNTQMSARTLDKVKEGTSWLLKEHQSIWRELRGHEHLQSISYFLEWYDELMKFERKLARM